MANAMKLCVIHNPYANRWRSRRKLDRLEAALRRHRLDYALRLTTAPGQAVELAAAVVDEGFEAVVAAGGDGTVSEVVNGLMLRAGDDAPLPLGIVPIGTGNDFAAMTGLPRSVEQAVAALASGVVRPIDLVRVNDRIFDNNAGVGMEPLVTIESARIRWLSGSARYLAGLIQALRRMSAWHMRVRWDDGQFDGPALLLSVCNSPRIGGLFHMAPDARLDDGLLDVVLIPKVPRAEIAAILVALLRGRHIARDSVRYFRTRRLEVNSEPGTPLHADGEVLAECISYLRFELLAQRLRLLGPWHDA